MSLAKTYCKEIIRELDVIPVYKPGAPVSVGDVISFGNGLFKPRPIGSFSHVTSLNNLKVKYDVNIDPNPDSYIFTSEGAVGASFKANANAASKASGTLSVGFAREGATYLAAADCSVHYINDVPKVEQQLMSKTGQVDWKNCFIVTAVTIASKALVMQSKSSEAYLTIEGDVKALDDQDASGFDANMELKVTKYGHAAFFKDWSPNVTVFFTLARFKKKFLGNWNVSARTMSTSILLNRETDSFELRGVDPSELIIEDLEKAIL